jgi:hypothetical protein
MYFEIFEKKKGMHDVLVVVDSNNNNKNNSSSSNNNPRKVYGAQ